jgi:serine phosphatase RsbU (regulator of sigma subunit)
MRAPAVPRRAVAGIALLVVCVALPTAAAQAPAAEPPQPPQPQPTPPSAHGLSLISITGGGKPIVEVSLPGSSSGSEPLVGVSLPSGNTSETQSVGVTVAGKPVVNVPVSSPATTTPTEKTPAPPSGGSHEGGNESPPKTTSGGAPPPPTTTPASPPAGGESTAGRVAFTGQGAAAQPSNTPSATTTHVANTTTPRATARTLPRGTPATRRHGQAGAAPGGATGALASASASATVRPATSASARPAGKHIASTGSRASGGPLDAIGRHIPLPLPVPDWSKPIIVLLLVVAAWFAARAQLASRRARRLEQQRSVLQHDVGVMQAALVPEVPAQLGGLAVSVAYRPADGPAAGGDFYDVFTVSTDAVAIILGDVAGHGHEALTRAALTRYTLRAYLQAGMEPRAALQLAGQALTDTSGDYLATVAVGVYNSARGTLTYALAGHPPPIVGGSAWALLEPPTACSSPPLGWSEPTGRRQSTLLLGAGTDVCFFSDGLTEARCGDGSARELLGRARLSELFDALGARAQASDLLAAVRDTAAATPDDMAACILTTERGAAAAPSRLDELETGGHALAAGHVRRFLGECGLSAPRIERALELAATTAAACGTAVLHVERAPSGATVTVDPPDVELASAAEQPLALSTS